MVNYYTEEFRAERFKILGGYSAFPPKPSDVHFHINTTGEAIAYPEIICSSFEVAHNEWLNLNFLVWVYSGFQSHLASIGEYQWTWLNGMCVEMRTCKEDCLEHRSPNIFYIP